ncbi:UNVERIFIED_CONTAM: Jasmonoyl--L-amino acid synthetase JAR6 [Sesamum latifolium]|uniref:Jasmonoyl--L-amino acid synthetase JAR6 n=1 Tax=Sesamum latifolium TaxID=2727402 RepID=A0AAW2U621_9LAMI
MLEKMGDRLDTEAVIQEFEMMSMDAGRAQRETLKKILEDNGETEYLLKWGLNGRTDPDNFSACVPIVTHMDLEPYIQRIADGDKSSILTGKPISTISLR